MAGFENRVVAITGGGGGIGKAAAMRFLEEGASVVLSSRRPEVLELARDELDPSGGRVALVAGDSSSPAGAQRVVDEAVERFGAIDVLVNSTGIFRPVPFLEQTEDQVEEALDSILRPTFFTSQAAARAMVERGIRGAIVNVGSMWALDAIATTPTSIYSAAQAGRHALTKNLAIELAPHGIRVNTVALAFVETPAYERFMSPDEARAVLDSVNDFHPLGRHGYPADVIGAILFYAGDDAGWITGTTMPIDGGVLAGRNALGSA
jgi:NAD(P)-dependent dehydrogenase (short-subunit alcohol dehydrogenase family)